jgi:hypothetical protein
MQKLICECGEKTRIINAGNHDPSTWKKSNRGYQKQKKPPIFRVVLRCTDPKCPKLYTVTGKSKSDVFAEIRRARKHDLRLRKSNDKPAATRTTPDLPTSPDE